MLRRALPRLFKNRSWSGKKGSTAYHFKDTTKIKPVPPIDATLGNRIETSGVQRTRSGAVGGLPATTAAKFRDINPASSAQSNKLRTLTLWSQLIRFDKPAGTMLLLIPTYWGTAMAVTRAIVFEGADLVVLQAPFIPLHLATLFLIGAWTMRSAGCIINDMWDREIDAKVARTKDRPLACGALTMTQASGMLAVHLGIGLVVVANLHPVAIQTAFCSIPLVAVYPLMKRITHLPQAFLGLTFNFGVFVGYAAVLGRVDWQICLPLYAASVFWTVLYDTIYGHQDKADDVKIGVKSTAILFGDTKLALYCLTLPFFILLNLAGYVGGQSVGFYLGNALATYYLVELIDHLNVNDPWSCKVAFQRNVRFGLLILLSICFGNLLWVIYACVETLHTTENSSLPTRALSAALRMNVAPTSSGLLASREDDDDKDANIESATEDDAAAREQRKQQHLPGTSLCDYSWIDRLCKPAVVYAIMSHRNGVEDPEIPVYMRREYMGENLSRLLRFLGVVNEETISKWEGLWYQTVDHYRVSGNLM